MRFFALAALALPLAACTEPLMELAELPEADLTEIPELVFNHALRDYQEALRAGLQLDKPGAGVGPVTHASLFQEYSRCFYMPATGVRLISADAAELLTQRTRSIVAEEARFAEICLGILRSSHRLQRNGIEEWSSPVKGKFVLIHYDP